MTFFRSRVRFSHHSLMRLRIIPTCIRHNVPNYFYTKLCACLLYTTICPYLRIYHCAYDTVGSLEVVVCKLYGFRSVDPSYSTRLYVRAHIDYELCPMQFSVYSKRRYLYCVTALDIYTILGAFRYIVSVSCGRETYSDGQPSKRKRFCRFFFLYVVNTDNRIRHDT